jgi:endonuclease YncB( thermonuclease family)
VHRLVSIALALALCACVAPASPTETSASTGSSVEAAVGVVRIVDGDTIVVALGGPRGMKVRLIGIDTPERDRCFFEAATRRMRELVEGKRVRLDKDVSETDRYGRLLRYVYSRTTFVNAVMVREGYASAATYPPDVAHASEFVALARVARVAKRGLWGGGCPP